MLGQCEFNGRKDVLHFKLLQAALEENISEKNSPKMYENIDEIRKSSDEEQNDHHKDYEEKHNGNRNQHKNEYQPINNKKNIRNDIGSKKIPALGSGKTIGFFCSFFRAPSLLSQKSFVNVCKTSNK